MEQSKAMEYGRRKASPDVLKPRNIYNSGPPVHTSRTAAENFMTADSGQSDYSLSKYKFG